MAVRGIRGAVNIKNNTKEEIISATKQLLEEIINQNSIEMDSICLLLFTVTHDLDAAFPAAAAREMGYNYTPLMCAQEIPVQGSMPKVVRILMQFNSDMPQKDINNVYLGETKTLRAE